MKHLVPRAGHLAWFSYPIAGIWGDYLIKQVIDQDGGDQKIIEYNLANHGQITEVTVEADVLQDDHNSCGLGDLVDGRVVQFWCPHAAQPMKYAISSAPGRGNAWDPEVTWNLGSGQFTYGFPFRYGSRFFFVTRQKLGTNQYRMLLYYNDDPNLDVGAWSGAIILSQAVDPFDHNYLCADFDPATGRLDCMWSIVDNDIQGPTGINVRTGVFHAYVDLSGADFTAYTSDGTPICSTTGTPKAFPIEVETDATKIWDLYPTQPEAWIMAVKSGGTNPAGIFATYDSPTNPALEHRYQWCQWDGAQWLVEAMVSEGENNGCMADNQTGGIAHYPGLAVFAEDTQNLYAAVGRWDKGFRLGKFTRSGVDTWTERVVAGSDGWSRNVRPIVPLNESGQIDPRCPVLVKRGGYLDYTLWNMSLTVLDETGEDLQAAGWGWFVDVTFDNAAVVGGPHGNAVLTISQEAGFPPEFWTAVNNDGSDIRVSRYRVNPSGDIWQPVEPLACHVQYIDKAGQKIILHVLAEHIGGSDGITIWFGNAGTGRHLDPFGGDAQGMAGDRATYDPKTYMRVYGYEATFGNFEDFLGLGSPLAPGGIVTRQVNSPWNTPTSIEMLDDSGWLDLSPQEWVNVNGSHEFWADPYNVDGTQDTWFTGTGDLNLASNYQYIRAAGNGPTRDYRAGRVSGNLADDPTAPAGTAFVFGKSAYGPEIQVNDRARATEVTTGGNSGLDGMRVGGLHRAAPANFSDARYDWMRTLWTAPGGSTGQGKHGADHHATLYRAGTQQATFFTFGTPVQISSSAIVPVGVSVGTGVSPPATVLAATHVPVGVSVGTGVSPGVTATTGPAVVPVGVSVSVGVSPPATAGTGGDTIVPVGLSASTGESPAVLALPGGLTVVAGISVGVGVSPPLIGPAVIGVGPSIEVGVSPPLAQIAGQFVMANYTYVRGYFSLLSAT